MPNAFNAAGVSRDMQPYERQALLERVDRESATVGATIPHSLAIDEAEVPLRERVLALQRTDELSAEQETERSELLVALRGRRAELLARLEEDPMDRETGEGVADRIVGLDRARAALRTAGEDVDIEEEIRERAVADADRWRSFLKRTRGGIDRSLDR